MSPVTHVAPTGRLLVSTVVAAMVAALMLALPAATSADHGAGQDTIHKDVVAVNGQPLADPDDPADPITVTEGDSVTYRITITAGTDGANAAATVEDNFTPTELDFDSASGGDCSLSDEGGGTKLTCAVTLDAQGEAALDATFTVVAEAPAEGEGCPTIQNVATVKTDAFEPRSSNQTQLEVCAAAAPAEPTATVMVMKHNCADVTTTAEFEEVEARAATNPTTPDAAFGPTVETVLECPTVVLPGDEQTAGTVAGGESTFDFNVTDADGTAVLSIDGMFAASAACETDVMYDADRSGDLDADVCLDLSHYEFEVNADGLVTVTETAPPSGFVFGALRLTPGSGDEAALVSAGGGQIVLDVSADEDGMIMLHVYNFAVSAAPQPTPAPTPTPAPGALPDTGIPANSGTSSHVALMGMLAVMLTGSTGVLAAMSRRSRR